MFTHFNVFNSFKNTNSVTVLPSKKAEVPKENKKTGFDKQSFYSGVGLSLVTLGALSGIYYFVRHGNASVRRYSTNPTTQTSDFHPYNFNNATVIYSSVGARNQTLDAKPVWNAVTGGFTESAPEKVSQPVKKPVTEKKSWRVQRKSEVTPGIIRQISVGIKDYMKKCGIDKNNNKVNPEALDDILTTAVGKENVIERPYLENGLKSLGRVKEYTSPNGRVYVLETHDSSKGVITRLYMQDKDKHLRAYLHADGTFRLNSYTSEEAHFNTTAKGKRWMENSKFNPNKPAD